MRVQLIIVLIIGGLGLPLSTGWANNIAVDNVTLEDKDTTGDTYDIEYDIAWDNSWYISGAPSLTANWDAAWVFAKYSVYNASSGWGDWGHCTLLNTGSVAAAGSQITFADTSAVYVGAFHYRSAAGTGSNNWDNNQLRWDYGADGVTDSDTVRVRVFAVETVYIPTGNFFIGDTDGDNAGNFKWQDGTSGAPVVTGTLGSAVNTVDNSYDDAQLEGAGIRIDGDGGLDTDADGTIDNASFPTGYSAFYMMKNEMSQGQYRDFLNSLTRTQQNTLTAIQTADYYVMSNTVNVNYRNGLRAPAAISSGAITFGNDLDGITAHNTTAGDGTFNESDDGEWVAVNYVSWMDQAAYCDWAGLRPFTELEYTKAARGGQVAVDDEYAWGDATLETATTSLTTSGESGEVPNQGNLNYSSCSPDGPYRVGGYGDATSTRANGGVGYYGNWELSGNLWERPVTVGNSTGRAFTGTHGDGVLSSDGYATNSDWPGASGGKVTGATGSGFRGGSWYDGSSSGRVAARTGAASTNTDRLNDSGARCARTSP